MQKLFQKVMKIFFVGPNPRKNIYCPTEEYIRTYSGMGSDVFLDGNITQVFKHNFLELKDMNRVMSRLKDENASISKQSKV